MAATLIVAVGCSESTPRAPATPGDPAVEGAPAVGLAAVRERGILRVLTRTNGTSYFVWRGQRMGFHYELAERLATRLGVRLQVIVPESWDAMIPLLQDGEADLATASITITPRRASRVRFTKPYALTHLRVVSGPGAERVEGPEGLAGRAVHVRRSSVYFPRLQAISRVLESAGREPIGIVEEEESRETEAILEDVARGELPYSVADHLIALANQVYLRELVIGPAISDPQPLAWAAHPDAEDLIAEVDAFFDEVKAGPVFNVLFSRYYETPRTAADRKRDRLYVDASGRISPYDRLIQREAQRYGFDWRLLVAQAYQESRSDPHAVSWAGARGLFQLMPATAEELGVTDPTDPAQSIRGGVRYLDRMRDALADVPDARERLRMALAAYNCGLGHVRDARKLAREKGLAPDRWEGVAEALHLLSHAEYAARATYGYVRASEPIAYVARIEALHRAYRHATGERD